MLLLILGLVAALPFGIGSIWTSFYVRQGNQWSVQNRPDRAAMAYQKALAMSPHSAKVYRHLGRALYQQRQWQEAWAAYQQALKLDPDLARDSRLAYTFNDIGKGLQEQGRGDEAIAAFQQATQLAPDYPPAYINLGQELYQQGQWDKAIAAYQQAIKLDPNFAQAHSDLGQALFQKKKYKQAITAYQQALKLDPNRADTYHALGKARFQHQQLRKAIAAYQQAIRLAPNNAHVYEDFCQALHQQRQYKKAIEQCEKAIALAPNLETAKFYLQEVPRQLALRQNPAVFLLPERLPSLQAEPDLLIKRSIVKVIVKTSSSSGSGTGWIVKQDGSKAYVVTNRHVVSGQDRYSTSNAQIEIEYYSNPLPGQFRRRQQARVIRATAPEEWLDLAVLEVNFPPPDIKPLSIASTSPLLGLPVRTIGHPQSGEDWTTFAGEIFGQSEQEIRFSAALTSGVSGGPVLNPQNQVIGVAVKASTLCQTTESAWSLGCGMAFPIKLVKEKLYDWNLL